MFRKPVLFAMSLLLASATHAAPVWQWLPAGALESLDMALPHEAVALREIRLAGAELRALTRDSVLVLPLPGGDLNYMVLGEQRFDNGDRGLRAVLDDGSGSYIVSMTLGERHLLATIYSPQGRYRLQAQREGDDYVGWLFQDSDQFRVLPRHRRVVDRDLALNRAADRELRAGDQPNRRAIRRVEKRQLEQRTWCIGRAHGADRTQSRIKQGQKTRALGSAQRGTLSAS